MARMEFLSSNLFCTTTQAKVDSGTATVGALFDRNDGVQYETVGYNSDTSTIISVEFDGPTVVSHLLLKGINLKQFRAFYNSTTASTFSTDINETTNSDTSTYYAFNSVTVSSVQLQMDVATAGNTEKKVGELIIANRKLQFAQNPSAKDYKPKMKRVKIIHRMPDQGVTAFNISNKYRTELKLNFITTAFHNSLKSLHESGEPLYFVPFPTTGADWDGFSKEVLWTSDFDFTFGEDSKTQGYTGKIVLEETSNT